MQVLLKGTCQHLHTKAANYTAKYSRSQTVLFS